MADAGSVAAVGLGVGFSDESTLLKQGKQVERLAVGDGLEGKAWSQGDEGFKDPDHRLGGVQSPEVECEGRFIHRVAA
jgi:hypothetical protein